MKTYTAAGVQKLIPVVKQALSLSANSAAQAINTDLYNVVHITAQSAAINLSTNLTGSPGISDTLLIDLTDAGSAVAITMGASFEASSQALPLTTVAGVRLDIACRRNTVTSKWRVVAVC